MAIYRKVYERLWRSPEFLSLDPFDRLLTLHCLAGQANRIGIFTFSPALAHEQTGIDPETLPERLGNVTRAFGWVYDERYRVLYIPSWWKWNRPLNPNIFQSLLSDADELPKSRLVYDFWQNEEHLSGTFLERFRNVRPTLAERSSRARQEQEQYQEDDDDRARGARPSSSSPNPLWSDTTQRVITEWEQVRGTQAYEDVDAIEAALEVWPEKDIVAKIRASRPYRPNGFQYITAALEKQARQGAATKPTRAPPARSKPEEDPYLKFANGGRG